MSRSAGRTLIILSVLLTACVSQPANAPSLSAEEQAARRSIVWLTQDAQIKDAEGVKALQDLFQDSVVTVYDSFNDSFALNLSAEEASARIEHGEELFTKRIKKLIDHIEPDSVIYAFQLPRTGCGDFGPLPPTTRPENIRRVGGPICPMEGCEPPANKVWLLDSGVDKDYDNRQLVLDNQNAADCTNASCRTGLVNSDDPFGHGTAIAGIIAGREHDGQGLLGVAPGATIVPVRILDYPSGTARPPVAGFMSNALTGLNYVKRKRLQNFAKAGDVVNISWGERANFQGYQLAIEGVVRDLADLDMKVVIAAGNLMPFSDAARECNPDEDHAPGGGYVATMVPARSGSYLSASGKGGVWTVSAVAIDGRFWFEQPAEQCPDGRTRSPYGSFFGNDITFADGSSVDAPPDFAEPGVSIPVLWIGDQTAICTGTSFSAPHLAGLLLRMDKPDVGGMSNGDPSAVTNGTSDPNKEDPIGVCKSSHPGCTYP